MWENKYRTPCFFSQGKEIWYFLTYIIKKRCWRENWLWGWSLRRGITSHLANFLLQWKWGKSRLLCKDPSENPARLRQEAVKKKKVIWIEASRVYSPPNPRALAVLTQANTSLLHSKVSDTGSDLSALLPVLGKHCASLSGSMGGLSGCRRHRKHQPLNITLEINVTQLTSCLGITGKQEEAPKLCLDSCVDRK